jgi:Cu2+-exporting ATPase
MEKISITAAVEGMTCASCAQTVENALRNVPGVEEASVNLFTHTATIVFDPSQTGPEMLQQAVDRTGYVLKPAVEAADNPDHAEKPEHHPDKKASRQLKNDLIYSGLLSIPVFVLGMFFMDQSWAAWVSLLLSAPVVFWFGRRFFIRGLKQLRYLNSNMDTLVALSTGIAWLYSAVNTFYPSLLHTSRNSAHHIYFESAAIIVFFILLGKWLEEKAGKRTRLALISIMKLQPHRAIINRFGKEEEVSVNEVNPGDELIIKPGMIIPVDGIVIRGESAVDESLLTGEPMFVEKTNQSPVWAGTLNQDGLLYVAAHKVGKQTYLAQLIEAVVKAQNSKAPIQRLADKVSGVFVPTVIVIAVFTFIAWALSGADDAITHAFSAAISVLIIACPCALGLATPTAITVAIGVGAKHGILFKNAASLETAARVKAVVLDKTGTITVGKPQVTYVRWLKPEYEEQHAHALYSIEKKSEHPLAVAIASFLAEKNYKNEAVTDFSAIRGRGIKASVDGIPYVIGSSAFMQELGIKRPPTQFRSPTETVSYFATGDVLLAEIHVEDVIKEGSKEAVEMLNRLGVRVHLATGDLNSAAETVAQEVGIKAIRAQMMPSQKRAYVEEIKKRGWVTAMVGDGVNDAEAMAAADISIAMAKGSDIAINVADITIANNDLRGVPRAIGLAKRTLKIIKQNLFWAFAYNVAAIPIATGFLYPYMGLQLDPMIAGAAMAFSSVTVVLNSLKLNKHNFNTAGFDITKPVH